jgi:hypothetical protein
MVQLQGIQRPIRFGHHMDAPFGTDQNCKIRRSVTRLNRAFGRLEQLHRIVHKPAHKSLIDAKLRDLRIFFKAWNIVR